MDFELSPEEEQDVAVGRAGGTEFKTKNSMCKGPEGGGGTETVEPTSPVDSIPSCAEKPPSDEQVSKNLFGPPLESAFDHEDFTGDEGGASGAWAWPAEE